MISFNRKARSKERRQFAPSQLLKQDGSITTTCSPDNFFSLTDGQLSFGQDVFSTVRTVDSAPFAVSSSNRDISTTFSVSGSEILWNNTAFEGGMARFCETASGIVAVYRGALLPTCFAISLILIPRKSMFQFTKYFNCGTLGKDWSLYSSN